MRSAVKRFLGLLKVRLVFPVSGHRNAAEGKEANVGETSSFDTALRTQTSTVDRFQEALILKRLSGYARQVVFPESITRPTGCLHPEGSGSF